MFANDNTSGASGSYIPSVSGAQFSGEDSRAGPNAILERDVRIVPEINGSGVAYIAFILGALGLWLYAGGARGRREEAVAAA